VYPIHLIVVGKTKQKSIITLESHYKQLVKAYIRLEIFEIQEGRGQTERRLLDEAVHIKAALSGHKKQVILDRGGAQRSSEEFAAWLGNIMDNGESLAFAIGSSHGFHPSLKAEIKESVSLSQMTFPHDLCRAMLLEQLFRACCILRGKPYHK
jgi:23S rRNA (pseudouridine1915-N3)-methyltransferase